MMVWVLQKKIAGGKHIACQPLGMVKNHCCSIKYAFLWKKILELIGGAATQNIAMLGVCVATHMFLNDNNKLSNKSFCCIPCHQCGANQTLPTLRLKIAVTEIINEHHRALK